MKREKENRDTMKNIQPDSSQAILYGQNDPNQVKDNEYEKGRHGKGIENTNEQGQ